MTTYVRAPEAARRLGVTLPTLYAYVSRGRIGRVKAADGRSSLFDLTEVDAVRAAGRKRRDEPPPSIDVHIASGVTRLGDDGLAYRGIPVAELTHRSFEDVAELLWSGALPSRRDPWTPHSAVTADGSARVDVSGRSPSTIDLLALTVACARSGAGADPDSGADATAEAMRTAPGAAAAARSLLAAIPVASGVTRVPGERFAGSVARIWIDDPAPEVVRCVDVALILLADHELATSTLAVRVAASVRSDPLLAIAAGLAVVDGPLHGSAPAHVHRFMTDSSTHGADRAIQRLLDRGELVPGFGHRVYRTQDPRVGPLLDALRRLPDPLGRMEVVDDVLEAAAPRLTRPPNVDLALGALTYVLDLPPDAPLFAIARIAGWAAHYAEEIDERPVRFRGLARPTA